MAASAEKKAPFIRKDQPYLLLFSAFIATIGLLLSASKRPLESFLNHNLWLEFILYYFLLAFLVVALLSLVQKCIYKKNYRAKALFAKPQAQSVFLVLSILVFVATAILAVDRWVFGLVEIVKLALSSEQNPQGLLPGAIYMLVHSKDIFLHGILTTIGLATFGTLIAFVLAILLVFARISEPDRQDNDFVRFVKLFGVKFAKVYSTVVRGTPMMVQAALIYALGFAFFRQFNMSASQISQIWTTFVAGLVIISLNSTAYMMEVLRGGIEAVDAGQTEAARSLGLSQWQAMIKVVFPQGIKNAIPALSNELVVNIKDSSVLSVIGVFDLMFATTSVAGIYYRQIEVYLIAALSYLMLTMVASALLNKLGHHLEVETAPVLSTSDMTVSAGSSTKALKSERVKVTNSSKK